MIAESPPRTGTMSKGLTLDDRVNGRVSLNGCVGNRATQREVCLRLLVSHDKLQRPRAEAEAARRLPHLTLTRLQAA